MSKTKIKHGDHVARQGELRLGCSAVILDPTRSSVLLTCRTDNGLWCLPGGRVDSGESVSESIMREVYEETGLYIQVVRLTGVYSDPNQLVIYPDGIKAHLVVLNFLVEYVSGEIRLSNETTDIRYFPLNQAVQMDLFHNHAQHLRDALSSKDTAFIN
jgi:ADP-ribose pyrophosphatase YjhB (NUDIX family)